MARPPQAELPADRVLLLDLDGTLVDTVPDLAAALNRQLRALGVPPLSYQETAPMVGDGVAKLAERAFAARGLTADPGTVADFARDYSEHAAVESRLFPDVEPVLLGLATEGWRLAVCTNKPEAAARSLLAALGLLPLLAAIGAGDSFPVRKPDPAHLLFTLAAAGGEPSRTVMVGDHANDVHAAVGARLPCIFAAWGYGPISMADGAAAVAHTIVEMAAIARRLLPAVG